MSTLSPHRVAISGSHPDYRVTIMPQGIAQSVSSFPAALQLAEKIARERLTALHNETAHQPMSGDAGPSHLLGSPSIFVIEEGGEAMVCVLNSPWGCASAETIFLGPRAGERAQAHGAKLLSAMRSMAIAEQCRRDRMKELARAERQAHSDQRRDRSGVPQ
jgi:hypothetical protein